MQYLEYYGYGGCVLLSGRVEFPPLDLFSAPEVW